MSFFAGSRSYGYDPFEENSDEYNSDQDISSDDDIDVLLHGTLEQRHRLQQQQKKIKQQKAAGAAKKQLPAESSSEDEFEREMNAELDRSVKSIELSRGNPTPSSSAPKTKATKADDSFYDQVYFDSDEEDITETPESARHAVISNEDLLYDPELDDKDQKWVDKLRQSHRAKSQSKQPAKGSKKDKQPGSDALLDCPACMTTLCLDCQRHETYHHQFRAMFVINCIVDRTESLACPEQAPKKKKKKNKKAETSDNGGETSAQPPASDLFHPVKCTECGTVVGVIDHDEVYHFFNVLASHT